MNIFVLDLNLQLNAKFHVDRHCVKMILEQSQMLATTHHLSGTDPDLIPYRKTHHNHPCNLWMRKSLSNYLWLINSTEELCKEYTYRYGKHHKCEEILKWCKGNSPNIPDLGLTPFAQAMPDEYKNEDAVTAYRAYYLGEKQHLFKWTKRPIPYWIMEKEKLMEEG